MANVIIGIHGLGNKPPKKVLEHWWKLAMMEGLKTNRYPEVLPKFELVYWADVLHEKPLDEYEKDEENPLFLKEKYKQASKVFPVDNHEIRRKMVDYLSQQMNRIFLNKDYSLNYSFITDVVVRKFFHDLEVYYTEDCTPENEYLCKVKDLIKGRLIRVLEKYKKDQIMLVSHSMGSIIAFDVLSFHTPHIPVHTFVTMGSPLGLPVVMSKIAAEQKRALPNVQRMVTPEAVSKHWYNFSDILDKITLNYKLDDDFESNRFGVKAVDNLVINNYEINGKRNPHKVFGYLRTPEFSKALDEFIQSERLTFKQKVVFEFNKLGQVVKELFSELKKLYGTK
ncbi:MAG: hypothetical protein Q8O72_17190 [Bacteroidales bacterium]|nr:hypothetical protein [Bacteroidales bacterium]